LAHFDTAYEESQVGIEEGRAMLNQMIGGSGDAFMGDETAHLKQHGNVTVEHLHDLADDASSL
jgi:hypothetical protein